MAMLNSEMVPSGKRLQKTMERSTMFNGKIHCFDWAIFNSFLYVYQRVWYPMIHCFFLLAIQDLQPKKKPGSLQNAFEAIDLDESGAISFEEFKKCGWTALSLAQPWNFPNNNFLRESEWKCNRDTNFMGI